MMTMLMTSLLSGEGDTFFSASPPVSNGRNCCWNIFMSASSPSAFLRQNTHLWAHALGDARRKKKEEKTILSPVHLSPLEEPSHQTRADTNEIPQGRLYKLARSRKGPRALGGEWSHRFKIPEPAPNYKIFACASKIRAHTRGAKENTNQRYSFFSPPRRPLSSRIEFLASFIHRLW